MESLHEANGGVLSNIMTVLKGVRGKAKDEIKKYHQDENNPYLGGDISRYSRDLIMTFPVMFDNSLPAKTASLINKANEKNIISMLQMLFASVMASGKTGKDVIEKFHKNISTSKSVYDVLDSLDTVADGIAIQVDTNESLTIKEKDLCRKLIAECKVYMNNLRSFPVESLSEKSLNDYLVYESQYGITVHEGIIDRSRQMDERRSSKNKDNQSQVQSVVAPGGNDKFGRTQLGPGKQEEVDKANAEKEEEEKKEKRFNNNKDSADFWKNVAEYQKSVLIPSDVKKANELAPSLLLVRYYDGTGNPNTFVAGVKSRLISVDAADIVERIAAKNKTAFNFKNIIRATTGEISFIKDLVLSLDQAKIDARNAVKKGPAAKMWNVLEYRGAKNSSHKLKKADNDASAITVLTINQETVNILKTNYRINLEDARTAKQFMDIYNLLGIVICDESIEVAKFLYSGNDQFEQYAYSFLTDKAGADETYKKIIDALAYGGRR